MNLIKRIKQWFDFSECSREKANWECKRQCKGEEDH